MSTILVATDFSPGADRALETSAELARALGDAVEICHVHEVTTYLIPPTRVAATVAPPRAQVRGAEKALSDRVERVRALDVPCSAHSVPDRRCRGAGGPGGPPSHPRRAERRAGAASTLSLGLSAFSV